MKILYVSQYYPPEIGAPAARVSELARHWARRGHDVTVLTAFPHHPHGVKRPEDRGVPCRVERDPQCPQVRLVRTYVYAAANAGFLKRIASYLSFMLSAVLLGVWRVGRPDVVVATSPQLFTGVAGWALGVLTWRPFVFEVRDLWPESIVTVGAMREGLAIRALKRLSAFLYAHATLIVTVGDGYRRRIVRDYGVDPAKTRVVTNGVDRDLFRPDPERRDALRRRHGWSGKTVALYLGTHGMAHGLHRVLETAAALRHRDDLCFVLVGDGAEKRRLVAQAEGMGLDNVEFLPAADKARVVAHYAAADLCLVPLRKVDLFTEVLPSKIFEIMAMRRPVVLSVDGDARRLIERAGAGVFVPPEDVPAMTAAVVRLADDAGLRRRLGDAGRACVERDFCRHRLADDYLAVLAALTGAAAARPDPQPLPAAA